MKALGSLLIFVAIITPLATAANANSQECSCEHLRAGESYAQTMLDENDTIVIGRVESTFAQDSDLFLRSRVAVELIYKGDNVPLVIEVRSPSDAGECAFPSIANSNTHLIALNKEDLGYSTGACRFFAVNYYEPSQTVSSDEYGPLVAALTRLAPPHPDIIPTPPIPTGNDIVHRDDGGGPPRAVVIPVIVGLLALVTGFALGRIASRRA